MSFLNCFAKCLANSKERKGHIKGSEAVKVIERMMDLSEQRACHGNHQRSSPKPTAPLILSNSSRVSTATSSHFATKTGFTFDRMAVENNLDTSGMFQKTFSPDVPQAVLSQASSFCSLSTTSASSCDFSLILPIPNRHSREQLRLRQAVDAISGLPSP